MRRNIRQSYCFDSAPTTRSTPVSNSAKKGLAFLVLALCLVSIETRSSAASINLSYSSEVGSGAPVWVAKELGLFEKYGNQVRMILIQGAASSVAALINGDVSVARFSPLLAIANNMKGMDLVMIMRFDDYVNNAIYGRKGITNIKQIQSLAMSRFGSSADFIGRLLLQRSGLRPDVDVSFLQFGNQTSRLLAIEYGRADAAIVTPPVNVLARKKGFPLLLDAEPLKIPYTSSVLVMRKSYIEKNRSVALNIVKAVIEGIHYYQTHKEESLKIMAKYLRIQDREVLEENFRAYDFSMHPYVSDAVLDLPLQELSRTDPAVLKADRAKFVDDSIVKELETSGFIDRLGR